MTNPSILDLKKPLRKEPPAAPQEPQEPQKNRFRAVIILLLVAIVSGITIYYFWNQTRKSTNNSQEVIQGEAQKIISAVGKLIVLPEGETPTVATVTDPEKLKDQPFFVKAKVGDKVLIYTNAKKAILYDPVQRKIIEVAPLNITY